MVIVNTLTPRDTMRQAIPKGKNPIRLFKNKKKITLCQSYYLHAGKSDGKRGPQTSRIENRHLYLLFHNRRR